MRPPHYHLTLQLETSSYDYLKQVVDEKGLPDITIECDDELLAKIAYNTVLKLILAVKGNTEPM